MNWKVPSININVQPLTEEQIQKLKEIVIFGGVGFCVGYFVGHKGKMYTYLNLNNLISILSHLI